MISVHTNLLHIQEQLEHIQTLIGHFQLQKCSSIGLADFLADNSDEVYILSTEIYDDLICKVVQARGILDSCVANFIKGSIQFLF